MQSWHKLAVLTLQNSTGFQKISQYCSQQLLPTGMLKTGSVIFIYPHLVIPDHIFNELTVCSFLMEDFLLFPRLRLNHT